MIKTTVGKDGVISFDGVPFVELPISELLAMPGQEASTKGVKVIDQRKVVRLHDVTASFNGQPVEFVVSLRVERSPMHQAEQDLVDRTATQREQNKAIRDAKETASQDRLIQAVTNTAINVAKQTAKVDPITDAVTKSIIGRLALGSGQ
jgi:hypothetical protein